MRVQVERKEATDCGVAECSRSGQVRTGRPPLSTTIPELSTRSLGFTDHANGFAPPSGFAGDQLRPSAENASLFSTFPMFVPSLSR